MSQKKKRVQVALHPRVQAEEQLLGLKTNSTHLFSLMNDPVGTVSSGFRVTKW